MEQQDPEFFKFLQENDSNLLDFDDSDDEAELSDSDEEEYPADAEGVDASGEQYGADDDDFGDHDRPLVEATSELVAAAVTAANQGSYSALKRLMAFFKAACIPANAEDSDSGSKGRYTVSSPELYNAIMVKTMENAYKGFYLQLGLKRGKVTSEVINKLEEDPRFKKVRSLILSFYKSILRSLDSLASTDQAREVVLYLVSSMEPYICLLAPMKRLAKSVLKVLLKLWSSGPSPAEDETHSRGHCFLRIRQLCIVLPGVMPEDCFKSIYVTFARNSKTFTELNESSITFMAQCVAELYKLDSVLAYQQGFLYIRQLALHLRAAYIKKTPESVRQVLNWQYLNCLRLWTRVICGMPSPDELGQLVFPLAQVMQGVLTIAVSAIYLPLRFHVVTCIQQLAANANAFIPLAPKLRDVFDLNDILSAPKPSTEVAPRFQYLVKLPSDDLAKPAVRDAIVEETVYLLRQESEIYRYNVAIPEYLYLTTRKLRHFCKQCKIGKWRDLAKTLINQNEEISSSAKRNRVTLGKAPVEITDFETLKPPALPSAAIRLGRLIASRAGGLNKIDEIIIGTETTATRDVQMPSTESWRLAKTKSSVKIQKDDELDIDAGNCSDEDEPARDAGNSKKKNSDKSQDKKSSKKNTKTENNRKKQAGKSASRDEEMPEDEVEDFVWSDSD